MNLSHYNEAADVGRLGLLLEQIKKLSDGPRVGRTTATRRCLWLEIASTAERRAQVISPTKSPCPPVDPHDVIIANEDTPIVFES